MNSLPPVTIEEVQEIVRQSERLLPRSGGSKPALSSPPEGVESLEMRRLSGVLEYQPGEFTFTALAGTSLTEVQQTLAQHGQYLPFDPILSGRGATLGGTVAAGVSGPGRYHYGGVRDFILGVRYVNGAGELVRGGGKVVKNSAGFDLPKLMVGSRGELGVLVELSFKVFPRPETYMTLRLDCSSLDQALQVMHQAGTARLDIDAIDMQPLSESVVSDPGYVVWVRLGGLPGILLERVRRLDTALCAVFSLPTHIIAGEEEAQLWEQGREMTWVPPEYSLIKIPLTPKRIPLLETAFKEGKQLRNGTPDGNNRVLRRYSVAGQVAWVACPAPLDDLASLLLSQNLAGLILLDGSATPRAEFSLEGDMRAAARPAMLGRVSGDAFLQRVKSALDPVHRFVSAG
jgi:glycolate oxidase FAD binding subunit